MEEQEAEVLKLELEVRKRRALVELAKLEQEERQLKGNASKSRVNDCIVRLNVGGTNFDTTANTLKGCAFFEAMLDGRFAQDMDEGSRYFVDRDPVIFAHLLGFLRTRRRPPANVLTTLWHELTAEAEYYGFDDFLHEIRGDTNPYDLRGVDRQMLRDEEECLEAFQQLGELEPWQHRHWNDRFLIDVFSQSRADFLRESPHALQLPLIFQETDDHYQSCDGLDSLAVKSFTEFRAAFNVITGGLLDDIDYPQGLLFAGGSVLSALTGVPCSDVDIFLVGLSNATARQQFDRILKAIKKNKQRTDESESWGATHLVVARTKLCVTIYRGIHDGAESLPVQIVLSTFRSPLEVILNFDIDCCCACYDLSAGKVWCLPRCRRALNTRCNIADTNMRSPNYEPRLEKYVARGFAIAIPGLREDRISKEMLAAEYYRDPDTDKLFRLGVATKLDEPVVHKGQSWGTRGRSLKGGKTFEFKADMERLAHITMGLQRLVVLARLEAAKLHSDIKFYEECLGAPAFHVVILRKSPLLPLVLAAKVPPKQMSAFFSDSESSEIEESSAHQILKKLVKNLTIARTASAQQTLLAAEPEETPQIVRGTRGDAGDEEAMLSLVALEGKFRNVVMRRLEKNQPLGVVYNVTSVADQDHSDLTFVYNACHGCLSDIATDEFLSRTGVHQLLEFRSCEERAESPYFGRVARSQYHKLKGNWFNGVYDA